MPDGACASSCSVQLAPQGDWFASPLAASDHIRPAKKASKGGPVGFLRAIWRLRRGLSSTGAAFSCQRPILVVLLSDENQFAQMMHIAKGMRAVFIHEVRTPAIMHACSFELRQ